VAGGIHRHGGWGAHTHACLDCVAHLLLSFLLATVWPGVASEQKCCKLCAQQTLGINLAPYTRRVMVMPENNCPFAGLAAVGCSSSCQTWLRVRYLCLSSAQKSSSEPFCVAPVVLSTREVRSCQAHPQAYSFICSRSGLCPYLFIFLASSYPLTGTNAPCAAYDRDNLSQLPALTSLGGDMAGPTKQSMSYLEICSTPSLFQGSYTATLSSPFHELGHNLGLQHRWSEVAVGQEQHAWNLQ
jgi:hypothetical protein